MIKLQIRPRVKKVIRRILASKPLLPLLLKYISSKIVKINDNLHPQLGILVLDRERFWPGELERLGEKTQLYEFPSDIRNFLYALFFNSEEVSALRTYNVTGDFKKKERKFINFLRGFIPKLASRIGFHCVITCNYIYVQNKLIAKACKMTSIPFVDIDRESKQDANLNNRFKDKYRKLQLHMGFFGNAICVYNENMKELLCDLNACSPEDIFVVGALRTDVLVNYRRTEKDNHPIQVTLFSFRHMPIGSDGIGYRGGFSPDGSKGYVRLFDGVHSAIGELASRNPQVKFVIKTKWLSGWHDYIEDSFKKNGFPFERLPNVSIIGEDGDAIGLILKSAVVIGLNSMTLVQARLAQKAAVIPYFDEIAGKYSDTLQYKDILDEFTVAHTREKLVESVQNHIDNPAEVPSKARVFDRYVGYTDGNNLDRVMSVLLKQCGISQK